MSKKISFVGLGTMGLPMVISLNEAGFEVIGYDALDGSRERVKAAGVTVTATLKEVAEQADDATVSMVRNYNQDVEVLLGEDGLFSVDPKGLAIIMMSTFDPDSMNALDQQIEAAADVRLIVTTVSGGATGAQTGMLSTMASGLGDRVDATRPRFGAVGSNTFYYGASPGNNQAAKLVNNMVLGIIMNGVAEGLKLGEHYNLPREALLNLFRTSTDDNWVARSWDSISKWTEGTALAVLLRDLKTAYLKSLEHGTAIPFNALPLTMLFDLWGQKPKAK